MDQAHPPPCHAAATPHPGRLLAGAVLVSMNLACVGLLWWPDPAGISVPDLLTGAAELLAASALISILWPGTGLALAWRIPPAFLAVTLCAAAMRSWGLDPDAVSGPRVLGSFALAVPAWPILAAAARWACRQPAAGAAEENPDDA